MTMTKAEEFGGRDPNNKHCVYCSDGEDWNPREAVGEIAETVNKGINMLSYVEVKPYHDLIDDDIGYEWGYSTLLPELQKEWKFQE